MKDTKKYDGMNMYEIAWAVADELLPGATNEQTWVLVNAFSAVYFRGQAYQAQTAERATRGECPHCGEAGVLHRPGDGQP